MNFNIEFISDNTQYTQQDLRKVSEGNRTRYEGHGIAVEDAAHCYENGLWEHRILVKNISNKPINILRAMPYCNIIGSNELTMQYFTSSWCKEYGLVEEKIKCLVLENETGRSSHGFYPQMFFKDEQGYKAAVCIAWSGNWKFELTLEKQHYILTAGMTDTNFCKTIMPREVFDSYRVLVVYPKDGSLDNISKAFVKWHRKYNSPKNAEAYKLPVEWNHWWPNDDVYVNEKMFKENVDVAVEIGCDICVLDAGWFGTGGSWFSVRGDWNKVNTERFPSGIRALSDYVHSKGIKFGIWCEIESLGVDSDLGNDNPSFIAKRHGEHLGYVCLGGQDAWNWAFSTLEKLIVDYNVDWIKVDFNLDPGYGCNRTDHGHGENDGLYEHYKGLYRLADAIHAKYPLVILEACSSGGLRIDHELLKHFDFNHMSDTDETIHKMKFYHHNLTVFPPEALLHWAWSDALVYEDGSSAFPPFTPWDAKYQPYEVDTHIRIGMLGVFGYSHRFNFFDEKTKNIFKEHTTIYKENANFIRNGLVYKLEPQIYTENIDLLAVQYLIESTQDALCFVFSKEQKNIIIKLKGLENESNYNVYNYDNKLNIKFTGIELMNGLDLGTLRPYESRIIKLIKCK